jgi:hypothetical protein
MKVRSEDVMWREVAGEVVILDLKTSTYLSTNATGTCLWKLLQEDCTLKDLQASVVETYGVDIETATKDVQAFLEMLRSNELLVE